MNKIIIFFIFLIYLGFVCRKQTGYYSFIPNLYNIYPNSNVELSLVLREIKKRTPEDIKFHKLTDKSVSPAFSQFLKMKKIKVCSKYLDKLLYKSNTINYIKRKKLKYNRLRPWQIYSNINKLESITANTPAYPAGHTFQAYLLAKILSKKYSQYKKELYKIADRCNLVRIRAGLHYPSDGKYSKLLIDKYYKA